MKKQPPTISMDFQDIDLDILADVLPHQTKSRFSALHSGLLEKIKTATGPFLFAAKNKFDENEINAITASVNGFLHKRNVGWRIRYSDKAKAFACFQTTPTKRRYIARNTNEKMSMSELLAFAQKVFKISLEKERLARRFKHLKAILYVGRHTCHIAVADMAETFGYNPTTPWRFISRAKKDPKAMELVEQLTAAVNEKLGA